MAAQWLRWRVVVMVVVVVVAPKNLFFANYIILRKAQYLLANHI
jgi:hypothetical protein